MDTQQHTTHRWPFFLPDGKHFIYLAANHKQRGPADGIYVGSVDGKENRRLMHASGNAIYTSGYLLFTQNGDLLAQRFDAGGLKLVSEPERLQQKVFYDAGIWRNLFSASETGLLLYAAASADLAGKVRWVSDTGQNLATLSEDGLANPRLSPDGRKIALEKGDPSSDIWVYDVAGPVRTQLTATARSYSPVWLPDGREILFATIGGATANNALATLMIAPLNNAEGAKTISPSPIYQSPTDWSRDGKYILLEKGAPGSSEIWAIETQPGSNDLGARWPLFTQRQVGRLCLQRVLAGRSVPGAVSRAWAKAADLHRWRLLSTLARRRARVVLL